jgi:hypothetical protein
MASSSEPRAARSSRWRLWLIACWVAGLGFFLSELVEIPWLSAMRGYDNTLNYLWLRSAMVDHDWDFANDVELTPTLAPESRAGIEGLPKTETGRVPNKYGIGWALLSLPFYLVADGIVAVGRVLGVWSLAPDGFNPVYQICILTGHAALALLSLVLATRIVRSWTGATDEAAAGVTLVWMAGPLLYYQTANLSMSHAATFFAITLMAFGLMRAREQPGRAGPWLLAGVGLGLAVVTRYQSAVFGLAVLWALAVEWRRGTRAAAAAAGWMAAAGAPLILLQMWAWRVVYGHWLFFGYGSEGDRFYWLKPHLTASLFSSWHGLFYWHPFLLVAVAGMVAWVWRRRDPAVAWVAAFFVIVYVNAAWSCWWLASAFGNRAYDAAMLPLMAGTAWLLARASPRVRNAIWALAIAAALWNVYVLLLYRTGTISRNEPVTWAQMISAVAHLGDNLILQ